MPNFRTGQRPSNPLVRSGAKQQVQATGDRSRAIFNSLSGNPEYKNKLIQPSFLRAEVTLKNGKANYEFSLQKDNNSDSITERKLDRTDKFLMSQMHMYLSHVIKGAEGCATLVTCERSFPIDESVFAAGETVTGSRELLSEYADLAVVYNGAISLTVGQTKFIEGIDTLCFRKESEFRPATNTGSVGFDPKNGALAITPNILLDGSLKTSVQLNIPVTNALKIQAADLNLKKWDEANNAFINEYLPCDHKVVLFLRGFLITNK